MNISTRLEAIAAFLTKGTYFADIGTDHAYLPCYVCLQDHQARAIAGEKNRGPFEQARKTVQAYQLEDRINVRLGDGLEVINNSPVSELIIAGMGGLLMVDILNNGKEYLSTIDRLILQPNIGEDHVRRWLINNYYVLTKETIMKEKDQIYEILVAEQTSPREADQPYTVGQREKELLFGPMLLKEKSAIFREKWTLRLEKKRKILQQMKSAQDQPLEKIKPFVETIEWIEEVLNSDTTDS